MPSVRFARDKRGYEYVYLVHTPSRRGKPGRSRVLYWYRTPPGVKIGREPFDREVREALERQYPGVAFDWDRIVSTPMPPPDMTEHWRERRRAERAAKAERRAAEAALRAPEGEEEAGPDGAAPQVRHAAEVEVERLATVDHTPDVHMSEASVLLSGTDAGAATPAGPGVSSPAGDEAAASEQETPAPGAAESAAPSRRRRRRGGRRRKGRGTAAASGESDGD